MRSRIAALCVCLVLLWASVAHAQFSPGTLVFDNFNWFENMSQTIHQLEMIKYQIQELAALTVYPIVGIAQDLQRLTMLLNRLKTLMPFDEGGIDALYTGTFATLPCTQGELEVWLASNHTILRQAFHGAALAQTLVNDVFELLDCITGIIDQVLAMAGNLQGLQTLGQLQSVMVHTQARLMAMIGSFQQAVSMDTIIKAATGESERCIRRAWLAPIPREDPFQRLRR